MEEIDGHKQMDLDGISLKYSFDDATAPEKHNEQYYELFGKWTIYKDGWKAVTIHGNRMPWIDPLPSWNEGKSKQSILDFVNDITNEASPNFVKPADIIATFDNDGTLWSEQPYYFQLQFALDRGKAMAPDEPIKEESAEKLLIDAAHEDLPKHFQDVILEKRYYINNIHAGSEYVAALLNSFIILKEFMKLAQNMLLAIPLNSKKYMFITIKE